MATPKQSAAEAKKEQSIRSMRFNRFLWFRYITAGFFFVNLYWMILLLGFDRMLWLLPGSLLLVDIAISVEQTYKYWLPTTALTVTKIGYFIQLFANSVVLVLVASGQAKTFFPFFNVTNLLLIYGILISGIILSLWVERRIWLIEHNRDKYFQRLQQFEGSLKL